MLPDGFHWAPRWQHDHGPNAIYCAGEVMAFMEVTVDGGWFARLDCHKPGPLRLKRCTSRELGRAGCEAWVSRYVDRLRAEAIAKASACPALKWQGKSSS